MDNACRQAARAEKERRRPIPARFTHARLSAPSRFNDFRANNNYNNNNTNKDWDDRRYASLRGPSAYTAGCRHYNDTTNVKR